MADLTRIRHSLNLGHFLGRDGCLLELLAYSSGDRWHPPGTVFATFYWANGDFSATNNLDNYGHGPGLEREFPATTQGLRIAANWFVCREERHHRERTAQERWKRRRES